ncbi:hypothetical protein [Mesonia sp. K4-1]|uniref:hypothetical protein n=1 Tax=Mesonia sp. K4-1 TaxID=2602760 RepID=UPI0011CC08CC|nr:hypothetical protein [Mesonia sp. K4-1]TXK75984.1 hypothetical protein FT986_08125 [Mesonia sp. K4-1]
MFLEVIGLQIGMNNMPENIKISNLKPNLKPLVFVYLEEKVINEIGVYKANLNSNNDIENWSKLVYDPSGQEAITEEECE